jgi:hypothetical protein
MNQSLSFPKFGNFISCFATNLFDAYAKIFKKVAAKYGIEITWGADWNRDNIKDKIKQDAPHFELTNWKKLI